MCGGFRRNFEEILSLPEQTPAKSKILQCCEGNPRTNAGIRSKAATLSTREAALLILKRQGCFVCSAFCCSVKRECNKMRCKKLTEIAIACY